MIINKALLKHARDLAKTKVDLILERDAALAQLTEHAAEIAKLRDALEIARDYVASTLADEARNFNGYEHCSNIEEIKQDLASIDAALAASEVK